MHVDHGEHQSARGSNQPQQNVLREQLPQQAATACAECRPHGNFCAPRKTAGKLQIGNIGAHHQQDKQRCTQNQVEVERSIFSIDPIQQRLNLDSPPLIRCWILPGQMFRDNFQFSLRLRRRHSPAQAPDNQVIVRTSIAKLGIGRRKGKIDIGRRRVLHCLRHHADHRVAMLVQFNLPPQDPDVAAEVRFPEAVAQHRHAVPAALRLALIEHAAHQGTRPHHAEEGRRRQLRLYVGRVASPGQAHIYRAANSHFFKRAALTLPVLKVPQGYLLVIASILLLIDGHHLVQVRHRQGTQNHGIHDAEDRRIGADADGQGQCRRNGESWRFA